MQKIIIWLVQKMRAVLVWSQTIAYLMRHRGKKTYGASQLRDLVDRYIIEKTATLGNYKETEIAIEDIAKLLTPINVNALVRFGATGDGGYVGLANSIPQLIISGGAGKNIDFEMELALLGSTVFLFDPTVKELPKNHSRITHVPFALCGANSQQFKKRMNLETALELGNQQSFSNIWLKLDIEGSEYDLLDEKLEHLDSFSQIFIEFHDTYRLLDPEFRAKFLRIVSYLSSNFYLISINSNNWQNIFNAGYGFIPVTFEATFLSKNVPIQATIAEKYVKLLSINNSERPHIPRLPFLHVGESNKESSNI
jgi:hypothetical protein